MLSVLCAKPLTWLPCACSYQAIAVVQPLSLLAPSANKQKEPGPPEGLWLLSGVEKSQAQCYDVRLLQHQPAALSCFVPQRSAWPFQRLTSRHQKKTKRRPCCLSDDATAITTMRIAASHQRASDAYICIGSTNVEALVIVAQEP